MAYEPKVVAIAGGVGGAKLAHGLAMVLPEGYLTVIGNVGDDFEHYGLHISPDLDTVMYTLAGRANPVTGWGLADETWNNLTMMQTYGEQTWFSLGDNDLATHILRTHLLHSGLRLTEIVQSFSRRLGVTQTILPVTDARLRTVVDTVEYGTLPFQVYFVKHRWQPKVRAVAYEGADTATLTPEVKAALGDADVIIFCPSNPILSIAPILAVSELRQLLSDRSIPSVVVSPLIGGQAVKGPTAKLMRELKLDPSVMQIARYYAGLFDTLVIDDVDQKHETALKKEFESIDVLTTSTLMSSIADRRTLSQHILEFIREAKLQ